MWFFSSDQQLLQRTTRHFATTALSPEASRCDEQESFHTQAFQHCAELGLLGLTIPIDFGGCGQGAVSTCIVMEELAAADAAFTLSYLAHTILCTHQIAQNGSVEQKNTYLPKLLNGKTIGGLGMSEPNAGSDALSMQTRAEIQPDGSYLLYGSKMWITNAPQGDLFYCYARTHESRHGISSFIVEKDIQGFSRGPSIKKMGMRGSPTGSLFFDACRIPSHARIGKEGESVPQMMKNLNLERIALSGMSLGIARTCLHIATKYASERHAFGRSIDQYQQIQERLAEGRTNFEASRCLTFQAAAKWDQGACGPLDAAMAKLHSAQMATKIALDAIQILGGAGYSREFPIERCMRDAKLLEIGGGTNEIQRILIAKNLSKEQAR